MKTPLLAAAAFYAATGFTFAHTWIAGSGDKELLRQHILEEWTQAHEKASSGEIKPVRLASMTSGLNLAAASVAGAGGAPAQAKAFQIFPKLELKWDKDFLYVGSNGWPDHPMMIGITAWQQQVPLPQAYFGANAWRIPLHPVVAKKPAIIEGHFLRGAIALAANGIPIFNPQNNRGEVSYEIGELDEWGGHCGRADDYHYHIVPLKLQSVVGQGMPLAYALDGYPIYGLTEPDGMPVGRLDECHGHEDAKWGYHYHASAKRPYLQSAFHGEVVEAGGQVDPQPRAQPVRPDTPPLRGAVITGFESTGANSYQLSYKIGEEKRAIRYSIESGGAYAFEYDNGREGIVKQTYTQRSGGPGGKGGGGGPERRGKGAAVVEAPQQQRAATPLRSTLDRNGDGIVTSQEFADEAKRAFATADADKSGTVSGDEWLAPGLTGLFATQMRDHAAIMDTNGDGVLSLAEVMAAARLLFSKADVNHDGKLERAEWAAIMPADSGAVAERTANETSPAKRREEGSASGATSSTSSNGAFILRSPEVEDGGNLPVDYTGDGSGATLPLEWKGAPAGTKSYALIMDHLAPGDEWKGYWNIWDIPANVTSLPKNVKGIGKVGVGFRGEIGYEPPKSKGPGPKTYVLHVYALSAAPKITASASSVNREVLLAAIKDKILASADLHVVYTRGKTEATGGKEAVQIKTDERPAAGGDQGGQRKPWMQMHGAELDSNRDGVVMLAEMTADMQKAIALYDANKDNVITPAEIEAAGDIREGAAFAGFIYRHAVDLDANNDSRLTNDELMAAVKYIFDTADQDHDGKLTAAEIETSPNAALPVPANGLTAQAPRSTAGIDPAPPPSQPVQAEKPAGPPAGGRGKGKGGGGKGGPDNKGLIKPSMADTIKVNVYADNWFVLFINGKLTAVDSIEFTPHNVVSVDILPEYPMTIAIMAKDNADPKTGMEYGDHVGDGGFIIKFADGTVSNASWKAKNFFKGPLNHDAKNPVVEHTPIPDKWWTVDFDDSKWPNATEFTEERVNPKEPYYNADFAGAKFIWSDDLDLDNTVIFRTKVEKPGWKPRWNTKPDLDISGAPFR